MNSEQMVQVLGTVAMEPKGDYSSEVYYEKLNIVLYNNSTYIAKQPSLGIPPTNSNYWQFISSSGLSDVDVVDNLDSTDATKVLSAKQGKILNDTINSYDYYTEITVKQEIYNDTTCYITTIPFKDKENNEIIPYVKYNNGLDISDYARRNKTTISMNCTLGVINPESGLSENAVVISDGEIIYNNMNPPTFLNDYYKFVGIKDGRIFTDYQANITTGEQMIADDVKQAFLCFGKLVDNGTITSYAQDSEDDVMSNYYPRQTIGVKSDKTIIVLTCDGRSTIDRGLTGIETAQLLIEKGCINAWNLDGGGSSNTVYKGSRVNKYISNFGLSTKERHIAFSLNFKKPTINKNVDEVMSNIGTEKANIIKMLMPLIPTPIYENPLDCDEFIEGINIITGYNSTNSPNNEATGYLLSIPISSNKNASFGKYCRQIWLSRDSNNIYVRSYIVDTFTRWQRLNSLFSAEINPVANQALGIGSNYNTIELSNVSDYMPSSLSVNANNQIITSIKGSIQVMAYFNLDIQLDTNVTIRLKKNNTNLKSVTISCKAGGKYQIFLIKQLVLDTSDTFEFTCNSDNNTGGVNTISGGNIEVLQNI